MFEYYEEKLIRGDRLTEREIEHICMKATEVLIQEPNIPTVSSPVLICGDIHGQFYDLLYIFELNGRPGFNKNNTENPKFGQVNPHKDRTPKKRTYDKKIDIKQCDIDKNFNDGLPKTYIFLGDYVDRGMQGVETMSLLLIYKILYPEHIYLVRGNHECKELNKSYGFYAEIKAKYRNTAVWRIISDVYDFLNVGVLINGRIFAVHGGISPNATSINQIQRIDRFQKDIVAEIPQNVSPIADYPDPSSQVNSAILSVFGLVPFFSPNKKPRTKDYYISKRGIYSQKNEQRYFNAFNDQIIHNVDSKTLESDDFHVKMHEFDKKIHSDILWSDPSTITGFKRNTRGIGVLYGNDVTNTFCELNDLIRIVRSHQLMFYGYKIEFKNLTCITVWSAPNYCYRCGNLASVMYVDDAMEINDETFRLFSAVEKQLPSDYDKRTQI